MVESEFEVPTPVTALAQDYQLDLIRLSRLNPSPTAITEKEILQLIEIERKYRDPDEKEIKITKANFYAVKGELSFKIQDKLTEIAYESMQRMRKKKPQNEAPKSDSQAEPEAIQDE